MKIEHWEFLERDVIKQEKYKDISETMKVSRRQLTEWAKELEIERKILANTRKIYKVKILNKTRSNAINDSNLNHFLEFREFYEQPNKCCYYCGLTQDEIEILFRRELIEYTRGGRRGKSLEIDRKNSKKPYSMIVNLAWACYWCNNAKTDEFSEVEFKPIGELIGKTLRERFNSHTGDGQ
jgi:hypothetical protein